jgi:uncharacterized protein (TIGR04255 family)
VNVSGKVSSQGSFREGPKRVLSKAPLVLVLAQVRFSPLMAMGDYISKIQDSLRHSGYPVNNTNQVQEISFGPQGPKSSFNWRWEFLSKERTHSVIVNEGFAVVQTSAYTDFDDFQKRVLDAVQTISDVVGGLLVTRIGLRYVDLIRPLEGETWERYVQEGMRGFSGKQYEAPPLQLHQVIGATPVGQMHFRLLQNRQGVFLPPDLLAEGLAFRVPPPAPNELFTILDMDHFTEISADFDRDILQKRFWQLKNVVHKTFMQELVTEHALKAWE